MKRPGWGGYILRTCERKRETERAEVARGGRRQGGWPWDGQGWGERFERASKWVVHLSQLAEIYFIPRLNLSSVVSLDQATACLDIRVSVYIYIYIVYTRRNYRATLFIVQIALWRLRCCSTLTRIVARYFTPVCQRDTHGSRLVECQNDVHIVALNATSCTKFRFNAFHRNFCLGSVCYNGIWIVTGSVAQLSCCWPFRHKSWD